MTTKEPTYIRVSISLTPEEAAAAQVIYDQLVNIDLFREIPAESYVLLDKFIKAVNGELRIHELVKRKGFEWGEKCGKCGHSSKDHAQMGIGLCVSESCNCMTFIASGKPA